MAEKEYIERETIKLKKIYSEERHEYVVPVAEIDWMVSADVALVRHGNWIKTANTWTHDYNERSKPIYYCSLCGRYEKLKEPYCNCGAKMDGGEGKCEK